MGFKGSLVLIGDEEALPYQRPPLSKRYLMGELTTDRLLFRHQAFYDDHHVKLKLGSAAHAIHLDEHSVVLASGESIVYDKLLLCLGASARRLTCAGASLPGVYYLRNLSDVPPIRAALREGARVIIVGGGYIGLQTAATARKLGCLVTVLEMSDRIMNRVVASNVSAYFENEHRQHGVQIVCNTRVDHLQGAERVERVVCGDGTSYECDSVIVGVGAIPNTELAQSAGLPKVEEYPGRSVDTVACRKRGADQPQEPNVFEGSLTDRLFKPGVVPARSHLQHPAHRSNVEALAIGFDKFIGLTDLPPYSHSYASALLRAGNAVSFSRPEKAGKSMAPMLRGP